MMYDNVNIQQFLNALNVDRLEEDGIMGRLTTQAIVNFQKANGLEPDGIWGPETETAATVVAFPIQKALCAAGCPVVQDGIIGSETLRALRSFQNQQGLEPDGIMGPLTAAVLFPQSQGIPKGYDPAHLPHFTADEFQCNCGCGGDVQPFMKVKLQQIRDRMNELLGDGADHPLIVTSGFRCPAQNAAEGGIEDSLHLQGLAVDCYTPDMDDAKFEALIEAAHAMGCTCGRYDASGFVHVQYGREDFTGD